MICVFDFREPRIKYTNRKMTKHCFSLHGKWCNCNFVNCGGGDGITAITMIITIVSKGIISEHKINNLHTTLCWTPEYLTNNFFFYFVVCGCFEWDCAILLLLNWCLHRKNNYGYILHGRHVLLHEHFMCIITNILKL